MLYKIRNLKKIFGNRAVLDIKELDIERGKIYTLIGPNGAGKTTLLNILAFLDSPSVGKITFLGQSTQFHKPRLQRYRQRVVLVDQYPILFTGPVWKSVEYGLKVRGMAKQQRLDRVVKVLEMVGMSDFYSADAHKLSGGETKRVALARALAIQPEVLLCDEPTANVDAENQEIILRILEEINRKEKVSLVFTTHYLSHANRFADHSIILENGRLSSAHRENIFPIRFVEMRGGKKIWLLGNTIQVALDSTEGGVHERLKAFIHPKGVVIGEVGDNVEDDDISLTGSIWKLERVNHSVRVSVDCGIRLVAQLALEDYKRKALQVGKIVQCRIPQEAVVFL